MSILARPRTAWRALRNEEAKLSAKHWATRHKAKESIKGIEEALKKSIETHS